jgi:hypothetical protein
MDAWCGIICSFYRRLGYHRQRIQSWGWEVMDISSRECEAGFSSDDYREQRRFVLTQLLYLDSISNDIPCSLQCSTYLETASGIPRQTPKLRVRDRSPTLKARGQSQVLPQALFIPRSATRSIGIVDALQALRQDLSTPILTTPTLRIRDALQVQPRDPLVRRPCRVRRLFKGL